jgi:hypothetical protein
MLRPAVALASLLVLLVASPTPAAFHFALIDEVMSGAGGNPNVQYVEIRMLTANQNFVARSRLTTWACDASNTATVRLLVPANVPNGIAGRRWIMGAPDSATFAAASTITPDFPFSPGIPASCGMVCWGAPATGPGLTPPLDPNSWDATNPANYIDCIAYGGYVGTVHPVPVQGSTVSGNPGDGMHSLTRTTDGPGTNNFDVVCPTPTNNANSTGNFGPCSPATTTTTLPPASLVKCEQGIAKASSKFAQAKMKALQQCEDAKIAGKLPQATDCKTEAGAAAKITKATTALGGAVGKACGGDDKACGTPPEVSPASIGWPGTCPNFESGTCNNAIANCSGISTCLGCVGEAAVDQAISLYYGNLNLPSTSDKALNACQKAIGKSAAKFFAAKSKALQKCWDARLKGKHSNPCPSPGDGKAAGAIAAAEQKKVAAICKACGGADKVCGGGDDLTPAQIGFVANCPSVTVPGGSSCAKPITTLQDIVDCVDCVTEFKNDCVDRLAVPALSAYPSECNAP